MVQEGSRSRTGGCSHNLGVLYTEGSGVAKSDATATRWTKAAAEQGLAMAQCGLGNIYNEGREVTQSYAEAARWYRKAADQGSRYNDCAIVHG